MNPRYTHRAFERRYEHVVINRRLFRAAVVAIVCWMVLATGGLIALFVQNADNTNALTHSARALRHANSAVAHADAAVSQADMALAAAVSAHQLATAISQARYRLIYEDCVHNNTANRRIVAVWTAITPPHKRRTTPHFHVLVEHLASASNPLHKDCRAYANRAARHG